MTARGNTMWRAAETASNLAGQDGSGLDDLELAEPSSAGGLLGLRGTATHPAASTPR